MDSQTESAACVFVLKKIRTTLRRDYDVATLSVLEKQILSELSRGDPVRIAAMSVMLLGIDPAVTPAFQKVVEHNLAEEHEKTVIQTWLRSLPGLVKRYTHTETNIGAFLVEAREEMVLSAPYPTVVPPPPPSAHTPTPR